MDKWLWFARFHKTRAQASGTVAAGRVRLNGEKVGKPSRAVGAGDMLTFPQGDRVRVVKIRGIGSRRGPASMARELYEDHTPGNGRVSRSAENGRALRSRSRNCQFLPPPKA